MPSDAPSTTASPPTVVARLREELARLEVDGLLIPRADLFQGEYVAPCDERLAYVSGFTGSAGAAVALADKAAIFVDGRYELQAANQVDASIFEVVAIRETKLSDWLSDNLTDGARLAYDPWLHGDAEVERLSAAAKKAGARLVALEANPIDAIWPDRPAPPDRPARIHPLAYAGEASTQKRAEIAETLTKEGLAAAFLSAPEGVCWLFNIRGADVPRLPVVRAQALIRNDGSATIFADPNQFDAEVRAHLGAEVTIAPFAALPDALAALSNQKLSLDRAAAPAAVSTRLRDAGGEPVWRSDETLRPKARKNAIEIAGARAAQRRDAAALIEVLAWIDRVAPQGQLDELTISNRLTEVRRRTAARLGSALEDLSFDAIVGFGPNGAIVHYRVDVDSSRKIEGDGLLLLDSGGQYLDGTTDVTRTVAIGAPLEAAKRPFTLVLKGMIALSQLRFPPKSAGRDVEAVARLPLWRAGLDFDHGVGHGVGSFLSVHEGPAAFSRRSGAALEEGMILSNEPGYYRAGDFGIRIENLVLVASAETPSGGDRSMHSLETLTLVPIDRRLIDGDLLNGAERAWLDAYHAHVLEEIGPLVDAETRNWLAAACAPL